MKRRPGIIFIGKAPKCSFVSRGLRCDNLSDVYIRQSSGSKYRCLMHYFSKNSSLKACRRCNGKVYIKSIYSWLCGICYIEWKSQNNV